MLWAILTFLKASDTSAFETKILLRGYLILSLIFLAKSLGNASPHSRHLGRSSVTVSRFKPPFVPPTVVGSYGSRVQRKVVDNPYLASHHGSQTGDSDVSSLGYFFLFEN